MSNSTLSEGRVERLGSLAVIECPVCKGVFVGRRNRLYCKPRCARKAARERALRRAEIREWMVTYHR